MASFAQKKLRTKNRANFLPVFERNKVKNVLNNGFWWDDPKKKTTIPKKILHN